MTIHKTSKNHPPNGQTADEELDEEEATRAVEENLQIQQTQAATKACVCGGTDHLRRSSVRCPLN